MTKGKCSSCHRLRPLYTFYRSFEKGRQYYCKECMNAYHKNQRMSVREKRNAQILRNIRKELRNG